MARGVEAGSLMTHFAKFYCEVHEPPLASLLRKRSSDARYRFGRSFYEAGQRGDPDCSLAVAVEHSLDQRLLEYGIPCLA